MLSGKFQQSRIDRSGGKDFVTEVDHKAERREERRKRAAGGKGGGGTQVNLIFFNFYFIFDGTTGFIVSNYQYFSISINDT